MHLNNTKVSYLRKTSSIVVHCKSNEAMPSSTLLSSRWENMCGNEPELSKGRMYVICVPTLLSTLHWGTYLLIMWVTASLLNLISFEILRWYPVPEQIYKTSKSLEQIITPELPTFLRDILDHKHIYLSSNLAILLMEGMSLTSWWALTPNEVPPPNDFLNLTPLFNTIIPCDQFVTKV